MTNVRKAIWEGPAARVDRVLPALGLARSRTHAAQLIDAKAVRIGNRTAVKPSASVGTGVRVTVLARDEWVSRSAAKLVHALDVFAVRPEGLCLDVGASTGGFTQVLLSRGATDVIALDVGHDQLDPAIRGDSRVRVVEGCNARYLTAASLAEAAGTSDPPSLIVGDLSFISLTLVLPALANITEPEATALLLIKPQFEVGREQVHGGVVRDRSQHEAAIHRVRDGALQSGFSVCGLTASPIAGTHGNREYLVHLQRLDDRHSSPAAGSVQQNRREWNQTVSAVVWDDAASAADDHRS